MATERMIRIGYRLAAEAKKLGINEREAEFCMAVAELNPALADLAKDLTSVKGEEKPIFTKQAPRVRTFTIEVLPFWKGEYLGGYPWVRFTTTNEVHLTEAGSPQFIPSSLIKKYIDADAPGVELGQKYCFMENMFFRCWLGKQNYVHPKQRASVLKKFRKYMTPEILRQIENNQLDLYHLGPKAPANAFRPVSEDEEREREIGLNGQPGDFLWNREMLVRLHTLMESLMKPELLSEKDDTKFANMLRKHGSNVNSSGKVDEYRTFTCLLGTYKSANLSEAEEEMVCDNQIATIEAILFVQYTNRGRHVAVLMDAKTFKRFLGSLVTERANVSWPGRLNYAIRLPASLVQKEVSNNLDAAIKAAYETLTKKEAAKAKRAEVEAAVKADKAETDSGFTTLGAQLAAKNQTLVEKLEEPEKESVQALRQQASSVEEEKPDSNTSSSSPPSP